MYLVCDDIRQTVAELKTKHIVDCSEIVDRGWGLMSTITISDAGQIGV